MRRSPTASASRAAAGRPREGVDAAVRIGGLDDSTPVARRVGESRRVVVASPKYLATWKRPRTPSDIASHRVIHFTGLAPGSEWTFRAGPADAGEARVSIIPSFVTNSAEAAIGHAEHVGELTMQLAYQGEGAVRAGCLKVVLAEFGHPPLPIRGVYPTTRLVSAKVRAFVDLAVRTSRWESTMERAIDNR